MLPVHWEQRILHALRDVELAVRQVLQHDNNAGVEEISIRLGVLRKVIETALESGE